MKRGFIFLRGFVVPKRTVVFGDVAADNGGRICGTVNGNVKVSGNLVVRKHGVVNGDVHGKNVWVKGVVKGNVFCEDKIYTDKNAEVKGHIYAREAFIDKESRISGGIAQLHDSSTGSSEPEDDLKMRTSSVINFRPQVEDVPQNWF